MTPVGYLGPPGTHSHAALGGDGVPLPTIHDVVRAVAAGELAEGLVPLENSTEGGVGATLDALAGTPEVVIIGEVVHPVTYALVAAEWVAPDQLTTVVSHPQGLAQCARWLRANVPGASVMPAASTAEAVIAVLAGHLPAPAGALATPLAAQLHGGVVIAEGVADEAGNVTRFVRIARTGSALDHAPPSGPTRTSVAWWGEGDASPGWLVRCLSEFAFRGVNLTRIESRPRRSQLGHYAFFADLDGPIADPAVAEAVEALRGQAETVRVLGSYPAAPVSPPAH